MDTDELLRKTLAWIVMRGCESCKKDCTCGRSDIIKETVKELERY